MRKWENHSRTVALIWAFSFSIFFLLLRLMMDTQSYSSLVADSPGGKVSDRMRREILYGKMEKDLDEHGAVFLKHGETSQSLSLSELVTLVDGVVTPVLKAANPPVRTNVLYLRPTYSKPFAEAVEQIFSPYFDKAIWFQNLSLYHFSMFHASHHISPVPAANSEIDAEAEDVKAVTQEICPLRIVLDRVVLTSTSILLGCWQVVSGTDPVSIRAKLKKGLPHAPEKQLYDAAILHTSFARLFGPPTASSADESEASQRLPFFHELVARLNNRIRGSQATVSELWYVEEYAVLALALNGRMRAHRYELSRSRSGA